MAQVYPPAVGINLTVVTTQLPNLVIFATLNFK